MEAFMKSDAEAKIGSRHQYSRTHRQYTKYSRSGGFSFSRHSWRLLLGRPSGVSARHGLLWLRSPLPNRSRSQQQHDDVEGTKTTGSPWTWLTRPIFPA